MMFDDWEYRWQYGIPYLLALLVGLWLCVYRRKSSPRMYTMATIAVLLALVFWFIGPLLSDWPSALMKEGYVSGTEVVYQSFIGSLFTLLPIGLMFIAIDVQLRRAAGNKRWTETLKSISVRYWLLLAAGILIALLLLSYVQSGPRYWFALIGSVPLLSVLLIGVSLTLKHGRNGEIAGTIAAIGLGSALAAWCIRPWLAMWLHLQRFDRTPIGYDYQTAQSLRMATAFLATACEAIPILLLLWAVTLVPSDGADSLHVSDDLATTRRLPPPYQPPPLPGAAFRALAAIVLWALGTGIGAVLLFIAGFAAYAILFTDHPFLDTPQGHGAWGPTTEAIVLFLGVIVMFVVGVVVGVIIAAQRASRRQ